MSISIRDLLSRQNIAKEVISLRNSLGNHYQGLEMGMREAHERFLKPADGNGYGRGCHRPTQSIAGDLAYVVPAWVSVHNHETRTLEGILTKSKITHTDFPLKPWHTYYDWCFYIRVDKQYTYLHSQSNIQDHGKDYGNGIEGEIECEWDTAFLPSWAWPQDGDRIWMAGRWIYDCGHPAAHGHKTEIHPPKAVVSFRKEAVEFAGNSGSTQANNAVLYIGRDGGYWRQPINDQDYEFDLYLPLKPYPEAVPRWRVVSKTGNLPVQPKVTPFPLDSPRLLRVVVPLKDVRPHPEQYGAIISGGWSDPLRTQSAQIKHLRVRVTKIYMDGDYDDWGDEWHVYIGINGRWKVWQDIGGWDESLNFSVDLDLHPSDRIHITACGFEEDLMHNYMGDNSGYTWAQISNPNLTDEQREDIEDSVFWQLAGSFNDENDKIGYFSKYHNFNERGTFTIVSDKRDYRLNYTIEER